MRRPPSHIVSFDPVGGQGDFIGLQECYRTGKYIVGTPFMASAFSVAEPRTRTP